MKLQYLNWCQQGSVPSVEFKSWMLISRIFKWSLAKICQTALNEVLQISRNPGNPASLCNYEKPQLLLKILMVSSAFVLNLQFYTYTPATWVPGSSPPVLHCQRALVKHLWAALYLLVNCSIQKEMQLILRSASGLVLEAVKWAPENSPCPGSSEACCWCAWVRNNPATLWMLSWSLPICVRQSI